MPDPPDLFEQLIERADRPRGADVVLAAARAQARRSTRRVVAVGATIAIFALGTAAIVDRDAAPKPGTSVTPTSASPTPSTSTTTTAPVNLAPFDVVKALTPQLAGVDPIASAAGSVWLSVVPHAGDGEVQAGVRLQRRDPLTASLTGTLNVPQDAVYSIAGDGDTLWVGGGGDGGNPDTTVSKIDLSTNQVLFTTTLHPDSCACALVTGDAGVWLVGNNSRYALHISASDGHEIARVDLPSAATTAFETRSRLLVGLANGSVEIVNPERNQTEGVVPLEGASGTSSVAAMTSASIPRIGSDPPIDGLIVRANGDAFALFATGWHANRFINLGFGPSVVTELDNWLWALSGDSLEIASTHAVASSEFVWNADQRRFDQRPAKGGTSDEGFRLVIPIANTLWLLNGGYSNASVIVVRVPPNFADHLP